MIKKNLITSIIALVFVFAAVWSIEAQTDSRLNGTWSGEVIEGYITEIKLNNGNFEILTNGVSDTRGTYTASNGVFTMKPVSVYGEAFNASAGVQLLEKKWYTINEFAGAIKNIFKQYGLSEADIDQILYLIVNPYPSTYSVDSSSLTLTTEIEGQKSVMTYKKR
ncbi:MAG: hypothetical protein FWC22_01145 [Treponema sp.]|nr:hypothetical protein [Treponema sp.]